MISSYYFWKWADNDLPGPPGEVHAALLRGQMHRAIQPFDPTQLLKLLEKGSGLARKVGEEWEWQVLPSPQATLANAIFATATLPDVIKPHEIRMAHVLWFYLLRNQLNIYGEGEAPGGGPVPEVQPHLQRPGHERI